MSNVLQMACRFLVFFFAKASDRAHVVVVLAFLPGLLGCLFACVPLDVLCTRVSGCLYEQQHSIITIEPQNIILPFTFASYPFGSLSISAAASPFSGSEGLGYRRRWGRKASKMLIMLYMGDQVWLMTSRHTEPELSCPLCQ